MSAETLSIVSIVLWAASFVGTLVLASRAREAWDSFREIQRQHWEGLDKRLVQQVIKTETIGEMVAAQADRVTAAAEVRHREVVRRLEVLAEEVISHVDSILATAQAVTASAKTLDDAVRRAVPASESFTILAKVYSDHAEILRSLLVELEASRAAQEAALVSIRAGADTIKSAAAQSLSGATKQSVAAESTGLSVQALAEAVRQAQTAAENAVSASAALDGLATKLDQATRSLENTNAIELAEHITSVAKQAVDYVEQLSANARKMGGKWDSTQKRDAARDFFEKQVAAHGITLTREQVVSAHRSIESVLGAAREG